MSSVKTKSKATKSKATKPKAKKTKTQAKAKSQAKSHSATKSKSTTKLKIHKKTKPSTRTLTHAKSQKEKPKRITTFAFFNDAQTETLLSLISRIINVKKNKRSGLKSFYAIDKILNKYNQQYVHPEEKFFAIIKYGMEKDPSIAHAHFYALVDGREKDENDLYRVLAEIGDGKIKFDAAKNAMQNIYEESAHEK